MSTAPIPDEDFLRGRVVVISGGGRGVGAGIAASVGRLGGIVVLLSRALGGAQAVPLLRTAELIEASGGTCWVQPVDLRDEESIDRAVAMIDSEFGVIDACINVDSVLSLPGTEVIPVATFDLMMQVNIRGTFLLTRACLPSLRRSSNPHILTVAPPVSLAPQWLGEHTPYTLSKYGMTILALGWAAEFRGDGIASNCIWPEQPVSPLVAQRLLLNRQSQADKAAEAMGRAACALLSADSMNVTGHCFTDREVSSWLERAAVRRHRE